MDRRLLPDSFLAERSHRVVLDVRSPGEYTQGFIPGALSFPLFTDEERAAVGTAYKNAGKDKAFALGLRFVGPKMESFVSRATALAPNKKLAMYCWRGGQRSGSMAWLMRQAGFEVVTLEGGYKAYRRFVLESFETLLLRMVVIGGKTGSGKTKILRALGELGEQIIDLEAIAHHKGSAFGNIGESPQPTVEQFENDLLDYLLGIDPSRRAWIENESRSIGRVYIPAGFWLQMKAARLIHVHIPQEVRMANLLADYVLTDPAELEAAFQKIASKLGGQNLKLALNALAEKDYASAANIALGYYDKTYQHGLEAKNQEDVQFLSFDHGDPQRIAQELAKIQLP